jgi:hypothetical protein
MKELYNVNYIVGGTCISSPVFMLVDHYYGVCVGIKIK